MLEGNIDILICALISIINSRKNDSLGDKFSDKFSNVLAYIFLVFLFYAPIHAILRVLYLNRLLKKNEPTSEDLKEIESVKELFDGFK